MKPIDQPQDSPDARRTCSRRNEPAALRDPNDPYVRSPSPDTFLEAEEVERLTDRIRRPAQVKVLRSMGIEHKVRPDGGIAILRSHITKVFDGHPEPNARKHQQAVSPNWLAI
jgi:hypothetical protein